MKAQARPHPLRPHPLAELFPDMADEEYQALKADIARNGQKLPVVLYQGMVLDGRHRLRACQELRIEPEFEEWSSRQKGNLAAWFHVQSLNLIRRHIPAEVRYALLLRAAERFPEVKRAIEQTRQEAVQRKLSNLKRGDKTPRNGHMTGSGESADAIGTLAGVSGSTAKRVERLRRLSSRLFDDLAEGKTTVQKALREAIRANTTSPLPKGRFRVIYADPSWDYQWEPPHRAKGIGGMLDHYRPMPLDEVCRLNVRDIAAPNAVLFLWVPSGMLEKSFQVVEAWGFDYKACFVWDKVRHNYGNYNSIRHEFLLLCTRGSCLPDDRKLFDSVVTLERGDKHSEKPAYFRDLIDKLYPKGRRIELFARKRAKSERKQ